MHPPRNVGDRILEQFRAHYQDASISKWDIFHYVYAVLHHPTYRERYAANLRRELPRIPFLKAGPSGRKNGGPQDDKGLVLGHNGGPQDDNSHSCHVERASASFAEASRNTPTQLPRSARDFGSGLRRPLSASTSTRAPTPGALAQDDKVSVSRLGGGPQDDKAVFWALVKAGERLADLHVNYEKQREYPLKRVESGQLDWRVQKMRLGKDKSSLVYNSFLTLSGIPPETYEYRLGNRSALEWVIDQYQVSTDKRSGITNDPNRADDPEYIVRLIGQVVYVSLETVKVVKSLPEFVVETTQAAKA